MTPSSSLSLFSPHTNVGKCFSFLQQIEEMSDNALFKERYLTIIQKNDPPASAPFLSIVMRTQGRRPLELLEALNSLDEQSDNDFEVLLCAHKVTPEQREGILSTCAKCRETVRSRIRIIDVDTGGRSTPLNYGLAHAHGEYAAFLDDDDLALPDWVRIFRKGAVRFPGTMIHCYVRKQKWERREDGSARPLMKADRLYCKNWNYLRQFSGNRSPINSVAFPAFLFKNFGVMFDETLDTQEDWDMMMRVASLTGVTDIPEDGALYRLWVNKDNSSTAHDTSIWESNKKAILSKVKKSHFLFSEKEIDFVNSLVANEDPQSQVFFSDKLHFSSIIKVIKMYYHMKLATLRKYF